MDSTDRKRSHPNDEDSEAAQSKTLRRNGDDNEATASTSTNGHSSNGEQQQQQEVVTTNGQSSNDQQQQEVVTSNGQSSNGEQQQKVETTNGSQDQSTKDDHQKSNGQSDVSKSLQILADASRSTVKVDDEDQKRNYREGRRGLRRPQAEDAKAKAEAENEDFVKTRKHGFVKTVDIRQSKNTQVVKLVSNYFSVKNNATLPIYQYDVFFDSEDLVGLTRTRCRILREHAEKLGPLYVFDGGALLFLFKKLDVDRLELFSIRPRTEEKVKITCTFTKLVDPFDPVNIQVYNIIIRNCMKTLDLCQLGRHYYDPSATVVNGRAKLEIWPGYKTSLRQHETSLMLCVEMTNKVLRQDTVHDILRKNRADQKNAEQLIGATVMTVYNKKTYRIDEIKSDVTPATLTFELRPKGMRKDETGTMISLADYMQQRYGLKVKDANQPILYSLAKKSQIRRGMAPKIALIPEFCQMTGLTDNQRADFNLMKDLNKTLQLSPTDRVRAIMKFSERLHTKAVPSKVLQPLGLDLEKQLVNLDGRKYNSEQINFGNGGNWTLGTGPRDRYDWMMKQQSGPMASVTKLENWAIVAMDPKAESFVKMIIDKARKMGFNISPSYGREKVQRNGNQKQNYLNAIGQIMAKYKSNIQMILVFLPKKEEDLYAAIKRRCYYEYGIPSQCVLEKHVTCKPGKESAQSGVAVKVAVQMNAKLGGIPWEVKVPVKGLMVIGFNISQTGQALALSSTTPSFGALVATTNDSLSQYYSTLVSYEQQSRGGGRATMSPLLGTKMAVLLHAYTSKNDNKLPGRIVFYRDGVGEGQLQSVVDIEIDAMKKSIKSIYDAANVALPSFTFVVVNKRINTKFFVNAGQQSNNPGPGTCVDSVVTLPERYDFFLVSQTGTGQGTVSPAAYNVIENTDGVMKALEPNHLQLLTYKLCHLYYNWTSTVSVPSVCQYAAKLAFLQNLIKKESGRDFCSEDLTPELQHSLYFL